MAKYRGTVEQKYLALAEVNYAVIEKLVAEEDEILESPSENLIQY